MKNSSIGKAQTKKQSNSNFSIIDNCYVFSKAYSEIWASNFIMKILYFIKLEDTGKYIIEFTNKDNLVKIIELTSEDFVSVNRIRTKIEPDFLFKGEMKELLEIKEQIFKGITSAIEITTLGFQPEHNVYAFSNGIISPENEFIPIDKYGIVSYKDKSFYLAAFSELNQNRESYINERKFIVTVN